MSTEDAGTIITELRIQAERILAEVRSHGARLDSHGRELDSIESRLRECEVRGAVSRSQLAAIVGGVSLLASGVVSVLAKVLGG
jgi:hypothetical protein